MNAEIICLFLYKLLFCRLLSIRVGFILFFFNYFKIRALLFLFKIRIIRVVGAVTFDFPMIAFDLII